MSRKIAVRLDADAHSSTARVASKSRKHRVPLDGRLVGEVITIAFDRCEAAPPGDGASADACAWPDALCTGCGTARCADHGVGPASERRCSHCAAPTLALATAAFEEVVDTRLRLTGERRR